MRDGGMGSLRFVDLAAQAPRSLRQVSEATFADIDGVLVSIAIIVDQENSLLELDVFKADNSALKQFPKPDDVVVVRPKEK
jgi:hypothetical protein